MENKKQIINNLTNNGANIVQCDDLNKHYFEDNMEISISFNKEKDAYVINCFKCKGNYTNE